MNIIKHTPSLATMVVPLARIIAEADLSWADKAIISEAIQACYTHWKEMQAESPHLNQQAQWGQQSAAGVLFGNEKCYSGK